jgi:hypothetical protein
MQREDYGKEEDVPPERWVSLPVAGDHQGHLHPPHLVSLFGCGSPTTKGRVLTEDHRAWIYIQVLLTFSLSQKMNPTIGWHYNSSFCSWAIFPNYTVGSWTSIQ